MFVTAFIGILNLQTGVLDYANAGHNTPLIYQDGQSYQWLETEPAFVLGGLDGIIYPDHETTLQPGDRIFLYTDGVTEAIDIYEKMYSDARLRTSLESIPRDCEIREVFEKIKDDVFAFAQGAEQADDITMLLLEYR